MGFRVLDDVTVGNDAGLPSGNKFDIDADRRKVCDPEFA